MTPSSSSSRNRLSDLLSSLEGEILVRVVMLCVFFVTEELQPFHRVIHKVCGSLSVLDQLAVTHLTEMCFVHILTIKHRTFSCFAGGVLAFGQSSDAFILSVVGSHLLCFPRSLLCDLRLLILSWRQRGSRQGKATGNRLAKLFSF